jgi:hypothetical protein
LRFGHHLRRQRDEHGGLLAVLDHQCLLEALATWCRGGDGVGSLVGRSPLAPLALRQLLAIDGDGQPWQADHVGGHLDREATDARGKGVDPLPGELDPLGLVGRRRQRERGLGHRQRRTELALSVVAIGQRQARADRDPHQRDRLLQLRACLRVVLLREQRQRFVVQLRGHPQIVRVVGPRGRRTGEDRERQRQRRPPPGPGGAARPAQHPWFADGHSAPP